MSDKLDKASAVSEGCIANYVRHLYIAKGQTETAAHTEANYVASVARAIAREEIVRAIIADPLPKDGTTGTDFTKKALEWLAEASRETLVEEVKTLWKLHIDDEETTRDVRTRIADLERELKEAKAVTELWKGKVGGAFKRRDTAEAVAEKAERELAELRQGAETNYHGWTSAEAEAARLRKAIEDAIAALQPEPPK